MPSNTSNQPVVIVEVTTQPAPDAERRLRRLAALLLGKSPPETKEKPEVAASGSDKNTPLEKEKIDVE